MFAKNSKLKFISEFRIFVVFCLFALMGIFVIPLLNIKLNPENSNKNLFIRFQFAGASPRTIENTITSRLEGIVASLNEVTEIQSESRYGEGQITIKLDKHTNTDKFKLKLNTAIRQSWIYFPEGLKYPEISLGVQSGHGRSAIMVYRVESNKALNDVNKFIEDVLTPRLLDIKGLKEVHSDGIYNKEIHFVINSKKVAELKISVNDIIQGIRSYAKEKELNQVEITNKTQSNLYTLKFTSNQNRAIDPQKVPIKSIGNRIITLSEITTTQQRQSKIVSRYRVNGVKNIYLRIFAEDQQNHLKLASRIKRFIDNQQHNQVEGIQIHLVSDSTEYVRNEIENIGYRLILTVLLLMISIWIIYRDRNYLLIIGISLAVNICISFLIYYVLGLEIHFYTMAGITLSFGMIIDNSIIVIDYLKKFSEKRIILPLFAATLTTIGALYVINVVPIQQDGFWYDFTLVIIVNLSLSFLSSLFFIPALVSKFSLKSIHPRRKIKLATIVRFNQIYLRYIVWAIKHKILIISVFVLIFGIPFYKLPDHVNDDVWLSKYYNSIFSNPIFLEKIRPVIDKATGGSLRLFTESVLDSYKVKIPQEKKLRISATSQKEYRFEHLDIKVKNLERFLLNVDGIEIIETEISQSKTASINISFEEKTGSMLPYMLIDEIAVYLKQNSGGIDWSLSFDEMQIMVKHEIQRNKNWGFFLYGYNFDELAVLAEKTKKRMLLNPRVRNVSINTSHSFFSNRTPKSQSVFYYYDSLNIKNSSIKRDILNVVSDMSEFPIYIGSFMSDDVLTKYYLNSTTKDSDLYLFMNKSRLLGDKYSRLKMHGNIKKEDSPLEIVRYNQQYQLFLNFDFIGPGIVARKYEQDQIYLLNNICPPGFSAGDKFKEIQDKQKVWLILISLIILIIFFITSILFESLKQAFWIVIIVPFSYIGVFLVFWLSNVNFDQGGFASFILLGGITVNASIYFINSFNNLVNYKDNCRRYLKAWNRMITPIFITILSTILGFIPFLTGKSEVLWKALATGTIGGLIFSLFVITVILPIALIKNKRE